MENAGLVPVMQKNGGYMRKWEFGWYDTNDYFPDPAWKWLGHGSGSEAALCGEDFLFDREGNRPNQRSHHPQSIHAADPEVCCSSYLKLLADYPHPQNHLPLQYWIKPFPGGWSDLPPCASLVLSLVH